MGYVKERKFAVVIVNKVCIVSLKTLGIAKRSALAYYNYYDKYEFMHLASS